MSSANLVATLGPRPSTFLGRATSGTYRKNVGEAEKFAENFVLVYAPPEPNTHPSDDECLGLVTQGKKTLAKALVF